jgi:hypothetical protein
MLEAVPSSSRLARLCALEPDADIQRETIALLRALEDEARERSAHATAAARVDLPAEIGGVRIEARIGTGGSGDVYRGVRRTNGAEQIVAVKRFHSHRAGPDDLERFAREQRMLAALTHPAIVRFFDAGLSADGRPYLVMELAEGWPIVQFSDDRQLGLTDRLALFLIVCDAVQSAHERLILHLDLKPSNVIVTREGHVKLVDFGTAKLADPSLELTRTEPLTVQYASPERLRGEPVSVACDVYSLGLILCELLSGGWPYARRESLVAIAERAAGTAPLVPLARLVTEDAAIRRGTTRPRLRNALGGDLDAIVANAIAHEPAARYASVDALADDLRRHLDHAPTHARATWRRRATARWMRRHRWAPIAAGVAFAAIGGAAAYSYSARHAQARPRVATAEATFDARTSMRAKSDPDGAVQVYDDFVTTDDTPITGATWRGVYCAEVMGGPAPPATAEAFLVGIYADADGHPDTSAPLHQAVYPVERTSQTLESVRNARCGRVVTTYAFYRYAVTLERPVAPLTGARYWFSVQAHVRHGQQPDGSTIYWGWQGRASANGSVQILTGDSVVRLSFDRVFSLVRGN